MLSHYEPTLRRPRTRPPRRTARAIVAFAAVATLVVSACGTRLSPDDAHQQLAAAYGTAGSTVGDQGAIGGTPGEPGVVDPGSAETTESGTAAENGAGTGTAGTAGAGTAAGRSGGQAGQDGAPGPAGDKKPIVIGMVGNFSGVIGSALAPARDSYAAWVKSVNAKGGINGHPIKLLIGDNGNRASQDLALAKTFVEKEKAIALVNMYPAAGGDPPLAKYAEERRVPIVGGAAFEPVWHASPMMFPPTAVGESQYFGIAKVIKGRGKTKVGAIFCAEASFCKDMKDRVKKHVQRMGMQMVYEGSVSLAQPDFTAQCVEARNRGAEAIVPVVDGASINRFAQACDRQGYRPQIVSISAQPDTPKYLEGLVALPASFPWFLQSGSPALNDYGAALRKYVSTKPNSYSSQGWVAGLLLGKALARVSDTPTSKDVLDGLWRLRGETLGGLVPPLTYTKGKPATDAACVYTVELKGGKWTTPTGTTPSPCKR